MANNLDLDGCSKGFNRLTACLRRVLWTTSNRNLWFMFWLVSLLLNIMQYLTLTLFSLPSLSYKQKLSLSLISLRNDFHHFTQSFSKVMRIRGYFLLNEIQTRDAAWITFKSEAFHSAPIWTGQAWLLFRLSVKGMLAHI